MEEIIQLLKDGKIEEALKLLTESQISETTISDLIKEYELLDRTIRTTQVGQIQKEKVIGEGEKTKIVTPVKIPASFQNKIVNTSVAFEIGRPVTLIASEENALSDEVLRLWRTNRIDAKLQKMKTLEKSELQCALLFHIKDLKPNNIFNRFLGANTKREIKSRILDNSSGKMSPTYDSLGDLIFFTWQFSTKNESGNEILNAWVYDNENIYKTSNEGGAMSLISDKPIEKHGFGKIPVVYINQKFIEWHFVEPMIDRLEVSMSKLGGSNDYSGHPILKIFGEVEGAPEKDEDGKAFLCQIKIDKDGKEIRSDVDFLTHDNAPESVKMEQERLEKMIYSLTSTPEISFDNIKGIGNVSGVALDLMFLDAQLKASNNNVQENHTIIERIINVMIAGTVTTTNTSMKSLVPNTYFDIQFNSVIPNDLETTINTLSTGVEARIVSQKTAVEKAGLTSDVEEEIEAINNPEGDSTGANGDGE